MADPDEKELVKQELGQRYYNHYLNLINNLDLQPQTPAIPAQEDTSTPGDADGSGEDESTTGQVHFNKENSDQPAESLSFDENIDNIPEVTPIKLELPASQNDAPEPAEEKASEKTVKQRFCFIATAAYGSPLADEVVLLQGFRDNYLSRNFLGGKLIQAYYRYSPYLAKQISRKRVLKLLTKLLLTPIILLIKRIFSHPGTS
jgi:hypothetical protein